MRKIEAASFLKGQLQPVASMKARMPDLTFLLWANALKDYTLAIGVVSTLTMIVLWWRRSQELLRVRNGIEANQIYVAYLLEAGKFRVTEAERADAEDCFARLRFAALLLATCNAIILLDASRVWREALRRQLEAHRPLLIVLLGLHEEPPLNKQVRELVDEVISSASCRSDVALGKPLAR